MTLYEINIYIEEYNKREKMRIRERAITDFKLAGMISAAVWYDGKHKQPEIYDYYGELFDETGKEMAWHKFKKELISFSLKHNKALNDKGGGVIGGCR